MLSCQREWAERVCAQVEDMNDIQREIDIMSSVDHPNVIKLYELFDEPKKMHLVMKVRL